MTTTAAGLMLDIYTVDTAAMPLRGGLDSTDRRTIDRMVVADALAVVPARAPKSGVRRRGAVDLEEWR